MIRLKRLLNGQYALRLFLAAAAGAVMFALAALTGESVLLSPLYEGAAIAALLCVAAMLPLIADRSLDWPALVPAAFCAAALIYLRVCMLYYPSGDYNSFLSGWVDQMRSLSLPEAMRADIGDYNMPYLYILFIISRLGVNDLFAIKTVSCLFDLLGAFFVMKTAAHFNPSAPSKIFAYLLTLALPTVWLNSAFWGQCDMMFTSLCVGSLYFTLKRRSAPACVTWALAFSFKLQAIFALPALILGLFGRRIKWRSLWIVPAVFFGTLVPALLCSRSFIDCVSIYFRQAGQYPSLTLNLPSIWALAGSVEFAPFNSAATYLAGAAVLLAIWLCVHYKAGLSDKNLLLAFYAFALLMPYLLPRMHDRYFFLADVAALCVFLVDRKKWYLPLVTVLASYSAYRAFVMSGALFDHKYSSVALLVVLTVTFKELFESLKKESGSSCAGQDFVLYDRSKEQN